MRTAEEILSAKFGCDVKFIETLDNHELAIEAMKEYAREVADAQSLEFAKWVDERYVLSVTQAYWFDPNTKEKFTHEQLINKYHEQRKGN